MSARPPHPFDIVTRVFAERLSNGARSAELSSLLAHDGLDWAAVVEVASEHFVLAGLAAALTDLGLAKELDPDLRDFLAFVLETNSCRNEQLRAQVVEAVSALNGADIEPILLKGAIRLFDGLYPSPAWRMMRDLDVLVPAERFEDAIRALTRCGYRVPHVARDTKDIKLRRDGAAPIEVHRELLSCASMSPVCARDLMARSKPVCIDTGAARFPDAEDQVVHLIAHSQIGHFNALYGRIALRDRLEATLLLRGAGAGIDVGRLKSAFAQSGHSRVVETFLLALGDGDLCSAGFPVKRDLLTACLQYRMSWQARSRVLSRLSLSVGFLIVMLQLQLRADTNGRPRFYQTASELVHDRNRRRRAFATIVGGGPHLW